MKGNLDQAIKEMILNDMSNNCMVILLMIPIVLLYTHSYFEISNLVHSLFLHWPH